MKKFYTLLLGTLVALSASATDLLAFKGKTAERAQISLNEKTAAEAAKANLNTFAKYATEGEAKPSRIAPKVNWVDAGTVSYTEDLMASTHPQVSSQTYDVALQVDESDENHFRLVNPYKNWNNPFVDIRYDDTKDYYMEFNVYDNSIVIFEDAELGLIITGEDEDGQEVEGPIGFTTQAASILGSLGSQLTPQILAQVYPDIVGNVTDGVITYPAFFYDEEENKNYYNFLIWMIDDENITAGGNADGNFQIVLPGGTIDPNRGWTEMGNGIWTETILSNIYETPAEDVTVQVQKSEKTDGLYRVVNPYKNWTNIFSDVTYDNSLTRYMVLHCEEAPFVWIEDFSTGLVSDEGELSILTQVAELCQKYGASVVAQVYPDAVGKIEDGIITFPNAFVDPEENRSYANFLVYIGALTNDTQFMGSATGTEFKLALPGSAGINSAAADTDSNAPVEYFNLQGVRVANPAAGELVIKRQGATVTKTIIR